MVFLHLMMDETTILDLDVSRIRDSSLAAEPRLVVCADIKVGAARGSLSHPHQQLAKMMRALVLLSLACCAAAQFNNFFQQQGFRRPSGGRQSGGRQGFQRPSAQNLRQGGGADDSFGGSSYHYSWRHDGGQKYTGGQAFGYCNGLGGGWSPVSINDPSEDNFISRVIQGERQEYIWTGGSKRGNGWAWADGSGVGNINWSHTGGSRRPQPDNREGNEVCLAILNNFYNDGVKWHDVACSHRKPTICERRG